MNSRWLVSVRDLKKYYSGGRVLNSFFTPAVDGISFDIFQGEAFGLVGESGCGKSTTAKVLVGLYRPTSGEVLLKGKNIFKNKNRSSLKLCKSMQMIFQGSSASLNPVMDIGTAVGEGLDIHHLSGPRERKSTVVKLLEQVELRAEEYNKFPHELSAGQRQRVSIARALAVEPEFLICDEPVSALDVSTQVQILALLKRLQQERGLTYLFISHDLQVVKNICTRVAVMYSGKIVELAHTNSLFTSPMHPYTRLLFSALNLDNSCEPVFINGTHKTDLSSGCVFAGSCKDAAEICREMAPELEEVAENHFAACHLF